MYEILRISFWSQIISKSQKMAEKTPTFYKF